MKPSREEIQAQAEKIHPAIERVATVKGWVLNENKDIADSVIGGLARSQLLYGKRYCPCRIPSGNEEEDKKIICPCQNSAKDIETDGHCHCYLYFKKQ